MRSSTNIALALGVGVASHLLVSVFSPSSAPLASSGSNAVQFDLQAPALEGRSLTGEEVSWSDHSGRAVILYFHGARTTNSAPALKQLGEALSETKELYDGCTLLLVVESVEDGKAAKLALPNLKCEVAVCVDEQRSLHAKYSVVAYPTAFVVDGKAHVLDAVRGFGTFFSFHCVTGCRLALGLIDEQTFRKLRHGDVVERDGVALRGSRQVKMLRMLLASGKHKAALSLVNGMAAKEDATPSLIALAAHLELLAGNEEQAAAWITRLELDASSDLRLSPLRARAALARGDLKSARSWLAEAQGSSLELKHARGLLLERDGQYKEAAALHRSALEMSLYLDD